MIKQYKEFMDKIKMFDIKKLEAGISNLDFYDKDTQIEMLKGMLFTTSIERDEIALEYKLLKNKYNATLKDNEWLIIRNNDLEAKFGVNTPPSDKMMVVELIDQLIDRLFVVKNQFDETRKERRKRMEEDNGT